MEYYTAKSYQSAERIGEPFEKNGKLYTKIREKCDRCVKGIYAVGVENGHIKPHPVAGGVCFKCGGAGYEIKEVRLYTEDELNKMEEINEKNRQKKLEAQEQKMKEEFKNKKAAWLLKNGFSAEGETYIITGDSFSIRDDLKEANWKYDPILRWHKADPAGYEDRVIKIKTEEVLEFSAWGQGVYLSSAKKYITNLLDGAKPESNSNWVGEVGERLKKIPVTLLSIHGFDGHYGYSQVVKFEDENQNIYTWFTAVGIKVEPGEQCLLTGTVKKHDEYKNEKVTILTRCRLT